METEKTRLWAEIDLAELEHNFREITRRLPEGCRFLGVVKADAYGHGAVQVAGLLEKLGAGYLAVACYDEAIQLRQAGIQMPILILGRVEPSLAPVLAAQEVTLSIGSLEDAKAVSAALAPGQQCRIHIKLDTGMGRLGFRAEEKAALAQAAEAMCLPGLTPEGVFTHFAVSDELPDGADFTRLQFSRFTQAVKQLEQSSGKAFALRHCANSGAVLHYPEMLLDMVRPGLLLYGLYPDPETEGLDLHPVMTIKARIAAIKQVRPGDSISYGRTFRAEAPMRVAVIPMGYADGLHRVLSNKMQVLIHGKPARQLGRICMDMCMVDVTDIPEAQTGDVAVIFGKDGKAVQPVETLAQLAGTISYEIVCAMSKRIPRIFCSGGEGRAV